MLKVGHVVTRPGRKLGDAPGDIPVPEELETVPGIPITSREVDFYSREYPLQRQEVEHAADMEWALSIGTEAMQEYGKEHDSTMEPFYALMNSSGDLEAAGTPTGEDVTELIKAHARELGYLEVGMTAHDPRYIYQDRRSHVKYTHAICLALEQDFVETQSAPSMAAEHGHYGTYEIQAPLGLKMVDFIRSLGYQAQVHGPSNHSAATIPMFVAAGLGQLGANGQLLTPHAGARCRLQIITTDAPVTYDEPQDYGIHNFWRSCQVCVTRCPGRALAGQQVWYRGVEKAKLTFERCRPVMTRYSGCGVCMKVCPVQRYGMQPVMEHFVETGEVLGKDTDNLEGYTIEERGGYFGPGKLPKFDRKFFDIPHGNREDWLFEQFKEAVKEKGGLDGESLGQFGSKLSELLEVEDTSRGDE